MHNAKLKFAGLLLLCSLLGFAVLTPASATAPSWVDVNKYAKYHGGIDIPQVGHALLDFDWNMVGWTPLHRINVTGAFLLDIDFPLFNMTGYGFSPGYEIVRVDTSLVTDEPWPFAFLGMEQISQKTALWVESTSGMAPSPVSIGGRSCVKVNGTAALPLPIPAFPITKYYDTETGMLMGLTLYINVSTFIQGQPPMGIQWLTFPLVLTSTNVFGFAWNVGGDLILWLESTAILAGISALLVLVFYLRKR